MLSKLSPVQSKEVEKAVKEARSVRRTAAAIGAFLGGTTAATAGMAAGNPGAAAPYLLTSSTTCIAFVGVLTQMRPDLLRNIYIREFGLDAPVLGRKAMVRALAIREVSRRPELGGDPRNGVALPNMRGAATMRDFYSAKKVIDLKAVPEAGKVFAPHLSTRELAGFGITRTSKLKLLDELKRKKGGNLGSDKYSLVPSFLIRREIRKLGVRRR
jgi:hypothetical protein